MKILVIEDDPSVRENLKDLLEENDYQVWLAENGKRGIAIANKNMPDLIICDIMMPQTDGLRVLRSLSKKTETAVIPFIFLTALAEMDDFRKGMMLGADDYITKPYDVPELLDVIKRKLEKKERLKNKLVNITKNESCKLNENGTLFLENKTEAGFVKIEDIVLISADNVYSLVYSKNGLNIPVRRTLKKWQSILPNTFLRISRSVIVNTVFIATIKKMKNGNYKILMCNVNMEFNVSDKYKSNFKTGAM